METYGPNVGGGISPVTLGCLSVMRAAASVRVAAWISSFFRASAARQSTARFLERMGAESPSCRYFSVSSFRQPSRHVWPTSFNDPLVYDGGHVGQDASASDGPFETLKMNSSRGAVLLVTSGNPTFVQNPARRELLAQLRAIRKRLVDQGAREVQVKRRRLASACKPRSRFLVAPYDGKSDIGNHVSGWCNIHASARSPQRVVALVITNLGPQIVTRSTTVRLTRL